MGYVRISLYVSVNHSAQKLGKVTYQILTINIFYFHDKILTTMEKLSNIGK